MKEARGGPPWTMALGAAFHILCFICAVHGAKPGQGAYTGKDREAHLPDHLDPTKIKPPVISVVSQSQTLIVNVQSDENLWKELGDQLEYRVLYRKEEEESFRMHGDFSFRSSHPSIEGLDAGVKYCVKVVYLAYNKRNLNVEPSNLECAIVTELEHTKQVRNVVVTGVVVTLLCVLVLVCLWMFVKNQKRLKKALRPPLSVPWHIQEFLLEDFEQPQLWRDAKFCSSSAEVVWDTISVVPLKATDEMDKTASPKIHFVVGGFMPEGPGEEQRPQSLRDPGQAKEETTSRNDTS